MAAEFHASRDFTDDRCNAIAALEPHNPFHTLSYAEAMKAIGAQPWLFYMDEQGRMTNGCLGFLRSGRLNRSLEIPSIPPFSSGDEFWMNLLSFCRQQRINHLSVDSFASSSTDIPCLPGETGRRARIEYVLDLRSPDLWSNMSTNHGRNIQKAQKAGVTVERSSSPEVCHDHTRLQDASMERRMSRGEQVSADAQVRTSTALVEHHAGEMFRATLGGQVLSSILVLLVPRGAYYHSAGTSTQGMAIGASHFLIRQVAETLRGEGAELFNLGGADASNPGLERFKTGFGAQAVHLEAAQFYLGSRLQKSFGALVDLVRRFADTSARNKGNSDSSARQLAQPS